MSKKIKIFIICSCIAYVAYNLLTVNNSIGMNNITNDSQESKPKGLFKGSIFSSDFFNLQKFRDKFQEKDTISNRLSSHEQFYQNSVVNKVNQNTDKKVNSFNINFDDEPAAIPVSPGANNSDNSYNNPVINDIMYMKNNPPTNESNIGHGETVFITDGSDGGSNQLISCVENSGSYKCHTAVSDLNDPQDILVINNYMYIVNRFKENESGAITKCNINSAGYISKCELTRINMINPTFFYYSPPYVYISQMVYSGGGEKPKQAFQCILDNKSGNLINCNQDYDTLSVYYYTKNYNKFYYRTHSWPSPPFIEKCDTIDAQICSPMSNKLLVYPTSLSINHDRIFISNAKDPSVAQEVLRCTMDMQSCSVVTNSLRAPRCIGVFNFGNSANKN